MADYIKTLQEMESYCIGKIAQLKSAPEDNDRKSAIADMQMKLDKIQKEIKVLTAAVVELSKI